MNDGPTDESHAAWLGAIESGEGYSLACPDGHGWLPPRRVCKTCGSTALDRTPLPETGTVETYTEIHVPAPRFEHESTVTVAIADFDSVRITGRVEDAGRDGLDRGSTVELDVGRSASTDERFVVFRRR